MKNVLTLVLALTSALAMAQWPTLPYNPDENGDEFGQTLWRWAE